ncbi:MAG TPA: mechanosensitive ion channel [Candidatus Brocadiia bacterium]|nr:mechanosensitive ion channel [Candidatus Brocadiia bacterium]
MTVKSKPDQFMSKAKIMFFVWAAIATGAFIANSALPDLARLPSGQTAPGVVGVVAIILAAGDLLKIATVLYLARRKRPLAEGVMLGRIYAMVVAFAAMMGVAYAFGKLTAFGAFFGAFGGMLLGWSLQAPVSGLAAWILVSLKRPFRPGDRIQFPNLGLTGDVKDIGPMYTMLDQVGGTIGSEEAVGRFILVPNPMLFSQVVINYTVTQEAPYMLDEVVIRITFDSDWQTAENILLSAANDVTKDIIAATGVQPYIRSDTYDYGVFLRLRYQTAVQDRAEIAYKINRRIFEEVQRTPTVDMAIPFVYSYRAGLDRKEADVAKAKDADQIRDVPISAIRCGPVDAEPQDIEQLAQSIAANGLLQPILVVKEQGSESYDIIAGQLRLEACRKLGWKVIPSIVKESQPGKNKPA